MSACNDINNSNHERHEHERRLRRRSHRRVRVRPTPWADRRERDDVGLALLTSALVLLSPTRQSSSSSSSSWKSGDGGPAWDGNGDEDDDDEAAAAVAAAAIERTLPRVSVWRIRSPGGAPLPHEVETTACLAEVALRDHRFRSWASRRGRRERDGPSSSRNGGGFPQSLPPSSGMELRLAYSAAVIRGVNGLADAAQDNRRNLDGGSRTLSVSLLCRRMGLPGWIVDVRHDAAHSPDLPPLPILRMAATTMVEFLAEAYWRPLREATADAEAAAAEMLGRYRAAAKGVAVATVTPAAAPSPFPGGGIGTGRKRPRGSVETKPAGANAGARGGKTTTTKEDDGAAAPPPTSPLECARDFVLSTTPDVGIPAAISFLVRGGGEPGEAPGASVAGGRGVLIPGSPSAFPETDLGTARIRERYLPLLETLQEAWPGFLHALLVDVVDFVLGIVGEADGDGDDEDGGSGNGVEDGDARPSPARRRKLFFLTSWIEYLLSSEFHRHLHSSSKSTNAVRGDDGGMATGRGTISTASSSTSVLLGRANLPLNGLCDRCSAALSSVSASSALHPVLGGLVDLFEGALRGGRVEGMGLGPCAPRPRRGNRKRGREEVELEEAERVFTSGATSSTDGATATGDEDGGAGGASAGGGGPMSLEEMEAMLLHGDEDGGDDDDDGQKDPTGCGGTSPEGNPAERPAEVDTLSDHTPWRKCRAWDPCAIGSLPGYPFRPFSKPGIR